MKGIVCQILKNVKYRKCFLGQTPDKKKRGIEISLAEVKEKSTLKVKLLMQSVFSDAGLLSNGDLCLVEPLHTSVC